MRAELLQILPLLLASLLGLAALVAGWRTARRRLSAARAASETILAEARQDAESQKKELLVAAQESILAGEERLDVRERELDDRESQLEQRGRTLEQQASELRRGKKRLERSISAAERMEQETAAAREAAEHDRAASHQELERIAGLTTAQARAELVSNIEEQARKDAARLARKIEDEAREMASHRAMNLMIQASQRVDIRDVVESTVSFIELPSDEMKGRIIGREGRNIRALELATGIDLIVDDTPRSILVSSFNPVRREIAHVAINRLVEDGRIHPGRIEEVVARVREEFDGMVCERGNEAAYGLGLSDLHERLIASVGLMRYHTCHGQNLLQHCLETAIIAGHMTREVGGRVEIAHRAGLLHEIGQVENKPSTQSILASSELCAKYGESDEVVHAIRSLHPDVEARSVEAMLLQTAKRISDNRPGARKENLAVFIERLKRLEGIAERFGGVERAFAVKAGKEVRVLIDARNANDQKAHKLCKEIARALERELSYPGQIKVTVVRETRAIRFAV